METISSFTSHPMAPHTAPVQTHSFYPYTSNGGSTLGISGATFTILAGDTRSVSGYNINTRYSPKLFRIGETTHVLSVVGYDADGRALQERLDTIARMYKHQHGKNMSISACAQRLSHVLYGKRFFPYYVHAILGGVDGEGRGALYSYDPVGSYEREFCRAAGSAASLIMPFLDNQVNYKNQYVPDDFDQAAPVQQTDLVRKGLEKKPVVPTPLELDVALKLVQDAFTSAVERHIEVGDGLQINIITKDGVEERLVPLKRD
ncbi:proteasome component C5 [Piedraia hortae CBS 480.64]|uniref:Proteasome component C5 n=1 Tax=Piedraia hortae CBS 480.64 TaxID=1314780 RepID=A0A6A7C9D1_9PEZI|nr:proteasome component C5 [Piedraia hortae CBS 480.64]